MFKKIVSFLQQDVNNIGKNSEVKESISETSIRLYNQAFSEAKMLSSIAKTLDNPSFQQSDFLFYLKIKSFFTQNKESYEGLENIAELLRIAINAQSNFLKIEQTELRYRSLKQQEYYDFVISFLGEKFDDDKEKNQKDELNQEDLIVHKKAKTKETKSNYSPEEFKQQIRAKLDEITSSIKTEQGKEALEDYTKSLESLAEEKDIGLKLLYLFKKYNLTDFSVLKTISDMATYLQDKNLSNLKAMEDLVIKNQDIFLKLGRIIGVPSHRENADTYSRLLQYLALTKKHEQNINQFNRLLGVMKSWLPYYSTIADFRQRYPESQYNLPDNFKQEIPGLSIYEKYETYLSVK